MIKRIKSHLQSKTRSKLVLMAFIIIPCSFSLMNAQADDKAAKSAEEAFRVDHNGLKEERNYHKGAGYKVELKGRFGSPRTAIIGKDGKLRIGHEPLPKDDDDDEMHHADKKGVRP